MPTTRRCMDSVDRPRQQRSQRTFSLIALKQPRPGCDQTGASTESRQDRVPVVCDRPTTTSTANVAAADRRLLHHSGPVCSRPRHLHRLRLVDADACSTYRVTVLRCATSDSSLCIPSATLQMVVDALVHSRLDYGIGVLVGLPAHLMRRLQSVLNATARLI